MSARVKFKFKRLNAKGKPATFLSERASIEEHVLRLGKQEISLGRLLYAARSPGHLTLQLEGETNPLVVRFTGGTAEKVLTALNVRASAERALRHRQDLDKAGKGKTFSSFVCPHCGYTSELSGLPSTPQAYCSYCDTVVTVKSPPSHEKHYHQCPTCRTYGRVKIYTSFFFVFALVFYYMRWQKRRECINCMRGKVWTTFFANVPFIAGVPLALWQVMRAYLPSVSPLSGVDLANLLVRRRKFDKAARQYQLIEHELKYCAQVRYNHALALGLADKAPQAVAKLEQALQDCANFTPAAQLLAGLYESLQMNDRLEALKRTWDEASLLAQGQQAALEAQAVGEQQPIGE